MINSKKNLKLSKIAAKPLKLNFWGLAVLAAAGGEMRPNYFQYTQLSFAKATEFF